MLRNLALLLIPICFVSLLSAQIITIDGSFNDWTSVKKYTDATGDGNDLDLLDVSITHDEEYLFLRVRVEQEISLVTPNYTNSQLKLHINSDNDIKTGRQDFRLGTELSIAFGDKKVTFDYPELNAYQGSFNDLGLIPLPSVTSTEWEMAIPLDAKPNGKNALFMSDTIHLYFETSEGDFLPKSGTAIEYIFTDKGFPELIPITLNRAEGLTLRMMSYNVLWGGLIDSKRQESFERIITATNPDIIGFSEVNGSETQIEQLLEDWFPGEDWYVDKQGSNLLASRYPILFSEPVWQGSTRSMATLVQLPLSTFGSKLLVVTAHPSCCTADAARQSQVDMIASFILEAKSKGGRLDLDENTPIVMLGDFNLVGWRQQLNTLLNGDIQDEVTYGAGTYLDWDDSPMEVASCRHTQKPLLYTWRNESSQFPPGKLDYIFYSGSVMDELKSFTLDTEELRSGELNYWGLNQDDALIASDHLPLVADLTPNFTVSAGEPKQSTLKVYPNPATDLLFMHTAIDTRFTLYDAQGREVLSGQLMGNESNLIDVSTLAKGLYSLKLDDGSRPVLLVVE